MALLNISIYFLVLASFDATVHAWRPAIVQKQRLRTKHRTLQRQFRPTRSCLFSFSVPPSSNVKNENTEQEILYQRYFYSFRPTSEVDNYNAFVVEERRRFVRVDENDTVQPLGPLTLILRDGQVEDGEIGDDLLTLQIQDHLRVDETDLESAVVTALYAACNPTSCSFGTVLELSCQLGVAGLLGCLGAGYTAQQQLTKKDQTSTGKPAKQGSMNVEDDILTVPSENKLWPPHLERLVLTDPDPSMLDAALTNVKNSRVAASKIKIDALDWTLRLPVLQQRQQQQQQMIGRTPTRTGLGRQETGWPSSAPVEYQTILASNLAFTVPEAKQLARTVATLLAPSSRIALPGSKEESYPVPKFIHIAPESRHDNEAPHLHRLLEKGYLMNVSTEYLLVEKLVFAVQSLSMQQAATYEQESAALDNMDLELKHLQENVYLSLKASHHPGYAGEGTGEFFFPIETGDYS